MGLAFSLSIPPVFVIRVLLGFFESIFGPALTSSTLSYLFLLGLQLTGASYRAMVSQRGTTHHPSYLAVDVRSRQSSLISIGIVSISH